MTGTPISTRPCSHKISKRTRAARSQICRETPRPNTVPLNASSIKEKGALALSARFDTFCSHSFILPVTDAVFERASDLWVLARRGGYAHNDADLIIAATALEAGRTRAVTRSTLLGFQTLFWTTGECLSAFG